MSIDPGTYTIQNAMHRSIAAQSPEGTIVADADSDSGPSYGLNLRMLWTLSRLNNEKYTIKNIGTNDYATSTTLPAIDDVIVARLTRQQWVIKETRSKGIYVIYTTASRIDLFWGLTNGELLTPVSLRDVPNHPANQWVLTKVASRRELEEESLQLRAKSAELQEENTKLRDSVDLLKADGEKASIDAQQEREQHEQANLQWRARLKELQEENTKLRNSIDLQKADMEQKSAVSQREIERVNLELQAMTSDAYERLVSLGEVEEKLKVAWGESFRYQKDRDMHKELAEKLKEELNELVHQR